MTLHDIARCWWSHCISLHIIAPLKPSIVQQAFWVQTPCVGIVQVWGGGIGNKITKHLARGGKPAVAVDSHPSLLQRMSAIVGVLLFYCKDWPAWTTSLLQWSPMTTGYQLLAGITDPNRSIFKFFTCVRRITNGEQIKCHIYTSTHTTARLHEHAYFTWNQHHYGRIQHWHLPSSWSIGLGNIIKEV